MPPLYLTVVEMDMPLKSIYRVVEKKHGDRPPKTIAFGCFWDKSNIQCQSRRWLDGRPAWQ